MHRVIAESQAAMGLLTRIPVARGVLDRPGAGAFPAVGAGIAAVAAIPYVALAAAAHEPVLAAIAGLAVIVALTGAIHLDGLADTADALLARDRDGAERARKDPAVGPGGVVAVTLVIAAEIAAMASTASAADALTMAATLVVAAGLGRFAPVVLASQRRRGERATGLGAWFTERVTTADAVLASISAAVLVIALSLGTSPSLALAQLIGAATGLVASWAVVQRRGGLDGDGFGAAVEVTFLAALAAVAIAT
jgi:adenosylcobinamide-GDP ribazoletransferase